MTDIFTVRLTKNAQNDLKNVPEHCVIKLQGWIQSIEKFGIRYTRKSSGFHDKPLHGQRKGQRSVRLNKTYRAFYIEKENDTIEFISIIEVNKHEY